ncbi:hypothetical protein D3C73_422510 [compost metagenome]
MRAFQLINEIEALACPQAEVFFVTKEGDVFAIEGGLLDKEDATGRVGLLLSTVSVVTEGGF